MLDGQIVGMEPNGNLIQYNAPLGKLYTSGESLAEYTAAHGYLRLTDDEVLVLLAAAKSLGRAIDAGPLSRLAWARALLLGAD